MRYLLLPFRPAPAMLVAVCTLLDALAIRAGLLGVALGTLATSWFFKYCYVLFDAALAGVEPPVLALEMLNPLNEPRPLAQMLMLLIYGVILGLVADRLGQVGLIAGIVLWVAFFPAIAALLGMTRNPFRAIHPPALVSLIRGIGMDYLWILIGACVGVLLIYALLPRLPLLWSVAVVQFSLLEFFAAVGGAMNEHRVALGFETLTPAERREAQDRTRHVAERDAMLARAYAEVRLRKPAAAWAELQAWIDAHCGGDTAWLEWSALLAASERWDDDRIADRLASACLERLVARGETGHALEVADRRFALNGRFVPVPQALATRLAELAKLGGKRALQRRLARSAGTESAP